MSATRNPYHQLPGGADLPGDVRVSDTADANKTAADGWAASPAAVANAVPELEYGCFVSPTTISENKIYQYTVNFSNSHSDVPKTVLLSYRTYSFFKGYVHIDTDKKTMVLIRTDLYLFIFQQISAMAAQGCLLTGLQFGDYNHPY